MKNPKFKIFKSDKNNEYYFNLTSRNGRIILSSEGYIQLEGAVDGIKSVRENAKSIYNFKTETSVDSQKYFVLLAQNNKVIGKSEMYKQLKSVDKGIRSVMKNSQTPNVEILVTEL